MGKKGGNGGGDVPWPWAEVAGDDWTPWPMSRPGSPTAIKELLERKVRVISIGDEAPTGNEEGRVTLLLNDEGRIVNVFFEGKRPTE